MKTVPNNITRRGSALLIVLGFLSFMMISAVSFAIYMRIERQASSNYRHSITARHLLDAALYRAMDEIDSELRIKNLNSVPNNVKFPSTWDGRVRASAVVNPGDNNKDARVLSLEALSFIPGILVNDVRRYAAPNPDDVDYDQDDPSQDWCGAKWRPLSMPVSSIVSTENGQQSEVGRFAYVCVNVSDMLDVNAVRAYATTYSNRVSIGQIVGQANQQNFDSNYKNKDIHYETLQDFYACMKVAGVGINSPYHNWIDGGNDQGFDTALQHVLVTDSIAKPEGVLTTNPNDDDLLNVNDRKQFSTAVENLATHLCKALNNTPTLPGNTEAIQQLKNYLTDYLDDNDTPAVVSGANGLFRPCTEMVPMVYQIGITGIKPQVKGVSEPLDPADPAKGTVDKVKLVLIPAGTYLMPVKLVFPFKYLQDRRANLPPGAAALTYDGYTLDTEVFMIAVNDATAANGADGFKTDSVFLQTTTDMAGLGRIVYRLPKPASSPVTLLTGTENNEANCYINSQVIIKVPADREYILFDSKKIAPDIGMNAGSKIRFALVVYVGVKNARGQFVDQAPAYAQAAVPPTAWDGCFLGMQLSGRLFFQTPAITLASTMPAKTELEMEWQTLEVPDPRFNHKASNWITGTDISAVGRREANDSTKKLLGKNGRDNDIFMFVSDNGTASKGTSGMLSPGEFGFIIRPFQTASAPDAGVVLKHQTVVALNAGDMTKESYYMFRTIRLYDHYDSDNNVTFRQDDVYKYFTYCNPDGTLAGARVNPLSDLPNVVGAAAEGAPCDYFWARGDAPVNTTANYTFGKVLGTATWLKYKAAWYACLTNAVMKSTINIQYKSNLSDFYGAQNLFGWSPKDPNSEDTIFETVVSGGYRLPGVVPVSVGQKLHEIDRKMLYSWTLDSFSDRQQLFLYVLRAEASMPAFGSSAAGGSKSLAGGRAVALVWRDPYPMGYKKTSDSWDIGGGPNKNLPWYTSEQLTHLSPWYQYNCRRAGKTVSTGKDESKTTSAGRDDLLDTRYNGFHDQRILYFKMLND